MAEIQNSIAPDLSYSLYIIGYNECHPAAVCETPMKIRSRRLTTCSASVDGANVDLEFLDQSGATVIVQLPFEQAEAVVMTLPHLLARALKQSTGNDEARYVFNLIEWSLESAKNRDCLIATLKTANGFEVSFSIPFEACRSLGFSLQRGVDAAVEVDKFGEEMVSANRSELN